jgi:hypothetical protein
VWRANDDPGSSGNGTSGRRRYLPQKTGSASKSLTSTILVAGGLLIVLFVAAVAGGYLK